MKKALQKRLAALTAASSALVAAGAAHADAPTTVGALASAVDFNDVGLGILAVAGTLIAVYVIWKGASFVINVVRRG